MFAPLLAAVSLWGGMVSDAHAQGQPQIYVGDAGGINMLNPDGTNQRRLVDTVLPVQDLKADAARVYWLSEGRIGAVTLDGKQINNALVNPILDLQAAGLGSAAFAIDAQHLYFAGDAGIGRANLDGSNVQPTLVSVTGTITSVAVDAGRIYWADAGAGRIGRARLDGTAVQPAFISELPKGEPKLEVAVGGGYVYWSYPGVEQSTETGPGLRYKSGIGRARLDGTDVRRPFRQVFRGGSSIAISRDYLYWGAETSGIFARMNLDGSDVFSCFYECIRGVGVDYPIAVSAAPPPKPSKLCSIKKTSVAWGKPLAASCPGVTGPVTVTVAYTLGSGSAAPAGLLGAQLRLSRTVRNGRFTIGTKEFCRTRFRTDRYRILFTSNGSRDIGAATVRLRSQKIKQRCGPASAGING